MTCVIKLNKGCKNPYDDYIRIETLKLNNKDCCIIYYNYYYYHHEQCFKFI